MALKPCKECGQEVSSQAKRCPHCGAKLKIGIMGKMAIAIGILFLLILLIVWRENKISGGDSGYTTLTLSSEQRELITTLETERLLRVNPSRNRADIQKRFWNELESSLKEDFAAGLAIYVGNEKGTQLYWVEVYDMQSGKKLAKYSRARGFKVY